MNPPALNVVFVLAVATTGCTSQEPPQSKPGNKANSWSTELLAFEQLACETTFVKSNPAHLAPAAKRYCQCVFDSIVSRWTPGELKSRAPIIVATLSEEGVISECEIKAAAQAGHEAAMDETSRIAKTVGMPDGFLGVRLLSGPTVLQATRPNATRTSIGWVEEAEWGGSKFKIIYSFDDLEKYVLMITLQRSSDVLAYNSIQSQLSEQYGPLTSPTAGDGRILYSERIAGGVTLFHSLTKVPSGNEVEQIALTKNKHSQ